MLLLLDLIVILSSLVEDLLLVSPLNNVNEDERNNHKIEGRFAHLFNMIAKESEVRFVATFTQEHNANDQQDEQAQHFIHTVFL